MSKIIKETVTLTIITLIAGIFLGLVYEITKAPIENQEQLAKQKAYQAVFEDAEQFVTAIPNEDSKLQKYLKDNGYEAQIINEVMIAYDINNEPLGYVLTVTDQEGYGGDITFTMGVKKDGTVNGISILSISETAGLGMKADTEEFKSQFADKKVKKFAYTKTGAAGEEQVDALSGATITTNAVTNGVNAGICASQYMEGGDQQ